MSTTTEADTSAGGTPAIEEILQRFPADSRLMSSPEGDSRGLAELRRAAAIRSNDQHPPQKRVD